jgi:hypothetical protein
MLRRRTGAASCEHSQNGASSYPLRMYLFRGELNLRACNSLSDIIRGESFELSRHVQTTPTTFNNLDIGDDKSRVLGLHPGQTPSASAQTYARWPSLGGAIAPPGP